MYSFARHIIRDLDQVKQLVHELESIRDVDATGIGMTHSTTTLTETPFWVQHCGAADKASTYSTGISWVLVGSCPGYSNS